MKKKKKQIPVPEPDRNTADDLLFPAASWNEMTGLIPTPAEDESERDSYDEMFPYMDNEQSEMREYY